ncbi:hypothetical protein BCR44DRAFT_1511410 [Catenaria anguillulae PL171]|uniref:DM14 domain-containing protein n=1 Tax=Catenaria anguillulae PL171 TaxID=765915 RepID=A0A1Y2HU61_9FUNG|nr:hypothetical protein BCR44DRAFT_1511410 [Catenaria anguillulae PL171]
MCMPSRPRHLLATPESAHDAATTRLAQYKRAAVAAKRLNDKQAALDFLRCAKQCEAILEHCEFAREGVLDWADARDSLPALPPPPPPHILAQLNAVATQAAPSASGPTLPSPQASSTNRPSSLPAILDALRSQIASCTAASAFYYARNDKTRALQFHRYKKTFSTDVAALEAMSPGDPLPAIDTLDVTYQRELSFPHLSMEEYEVLIERANGLSLTKSGLAPGSSVPVVVIWEVGYPEATGKGETTVVNTASADTDINQSFRIGIGDRKNKALQRHLERRKASLEVLYQSGGLFGSGLFSSRVSLGKAQLKLDALLTKSEIHEVVKLVDANRRPMGGSLEIRIRMRQPLLRADVAELNERWITLRRSDAGVPVVSPTTATNPSTGLQHPPSRSRSPSPSPKRQQATPIPTAPDAPPSPAVPTPATPAIKPAAASAVASPAPPQASAPSAAPAAAIADVSTAPASTDDLQSSLDYFESPDSLQSCLVLEHELQLLAGASGEAIEDRRSALQLKLQLLQLNVEMGTLTMEAYKAQLERGIADAKKHAVALKRGSKLAEAKRVLGWINLMKQEVGEIEGMLAGAAQEGEGE